MSVKTSNFNLLFSMAACYANSGADRQWAGSGSNFKTYFEGSLIHQLIIMYHVEHIHHDNPLNFFS